MCQSSNNEIVNISTNKNYIRPDYSYPYKPKKESIEFFTWVNVFMPNEGHETPKMHYMLIDEVLRDKINVQAVVHREGAKTTVLTKFLPLRIAAEGRLPNFGRVVNCCIFSATYAQAVGILTGIKMAWENSPGLQQILKMAKKKDGKKVADRENHICFENKDGKWMHIQAIGSGEDMRGKKVASELGREHRIELFLFDDILKDATLDSEKEREDTKKWFSSSVHQARNSEHYKKIVVGTLMTQDDLLSVLMKGNTFHTIVFPVANKFTTDKLKLISSWPSLHSPERILNDYYEAVDLGTTNEFFREKMLEVVNDEMRIFKEDYFTYYEYHQTKSLRKNWTFYTTMDLAVSSKQSGDLTSIITIGVNDDNIWYIVAIDVGRFNPSEVIDILFNHVSRFNPLVVKGEEAALQQVLDHFINTEMEKRKTYFILEKLKSNTINSKEYRIRALEPKMKQKKIYFPTDIDKDSMSELLSEMKGYTKTGATTAKKDAIDCLANFMDKDFVIPPMIYGGSEIEHSDLEYTDNQYDYFS